MRAARRRLGRSLGAAILAALLLLPLASSGHDHGADPGASRECGTCVAVRHTPSLAPAVAPGCAPRLVGVAFQPVAPAVSSATPQARPLGRAPPRSVVVALV